MEENPKLRKRMLAARDAFDKAKRDNEKLLRTYIDQMRELRRTIEGLEEVS